MASRKLVGMIKPASSRSSASLPTSSRPVPSWSSGSPIGRRVLQLRRMLSLPSATANCLTRSPVADTIFFRFFQVSFPASLYYFRDVRSHGQFQQLDQPAQGLRKIPPRKEESPTYKTSGLHQLAFGNQAPAHCLRTQGDLEDREQGWCVASQTTTPQPPATRGASLEQRAILRQAESPTDFRSYVFR